jgi:hypothetical protein
MFAYPDRSPRPVPAPATGPFATQPARALATCDARFARACRSPDRTSWSACPPRCGSPRGRRKGQPALRGFLPHRQHDRRLTQTWVRSATSASSCSSPRRRARFPRRQGGFPASRKSAFHRPIDCSLIFSRRAASAIDIYRRLRSSRSGPFVSAGYKGLPMSQTLLQD